MTDKQLSEFTQIALDETLKLIAKIASYTAIVFAETDNPLSIPDQSRMCRAVTEGVAAAVESARAACDKSDAIYARDGEEGLKRDIARSLAMRAANEARN